jgi:site-specific DNA-methyltransferase (adenine-specific)
MTFQSKANLVVEQAKRLAPTVTNWADFASEIFGPKEGLVAKTFPDDAERQLFLDSEQYKSLSQMRLKLIKKFGTANGATPEKSGRVLIRLPKSVHKTLEVEAAKEGVSLNQLAVSKLAIPLREHVDYSIPAIAEAYTRVYDGYSTDRIVVDPDINGAFLAACRKLGLTESDYRLNHALLDIRKSKKVELPKATKRTEFRDYDQYQFASEIAVRIVQRSNGVTLDQILCDPALAFEFDRIAKQLAPGQTALKLRCAALNLRKTRRLVPLKPITKQGIIGLILAGPFGKVKPTDLPEDAGVYSIFDHNKALFAGETDSLQDRLRRHLEGKLPNWLGVTDDYGCVVKYGPMPTAKADDRKNWLYRFINEERPLLNYQRSA